MKQLLIDITSLANELRFNRPAHGIPRVTLAYIKYFQKDLLVLFRFRNNVYIFSESISKKIIKKLMFWNSQYFREILKLVFIGMIKGHKMHQDTHYILLKTDYGGLKNKNYIQSLKRKKISIISMIHDILPIQYPEYHSVEHTERFSNILKLILNHASGILTVSTYTQKTLQDYIHTHHLLSPKILTARLAPGLSKRKKLFNENIKEPYFVTVSSINDRKNHLILMYVWKKLIEKYGAKAPKLIVIGKRTKSSVLINSMLDKMTILNGFIVETNCPDDALANYLSHATALLFPTFAEGYGLPLIEALSFNVPVIASNLEVFQEIAGDIPDYLDPIDGLGWLKYIEDYMQLNSEMRSNQLERLKNFKIPSWKDHFTQVEKFIDEITDSIPECI